MTKETEHDIFTDKVKQPRLLIGQGLPGKAVAMAGKVQLPRGQADHHVSAVHVGGELYLPVMLAAPHQSRVPHNSGGAGAKNTG